MSDSFDVGRMRATSMDGVCCFPNIYQWLMWVVVKEKEWGQSPAPTARLVTAGVATTGLGSRVASDAQEVAPANSGVDTAIVVLLVQQSESLGSGEGVCGCACPSAGTGTCVGLNIHILRDGRSVEVLP